MWRRFTAKRPRRNLSRYIHTGGFHRLSGRRRERRVRNYARNRLIWAAVFAAVVLGGLFFVLF